MVKKTTHKINISYLLSPISILLLWECLARFQIINIIYFPAPLNIMNHSIHLIFKDFIFLSDIIHSLKRLIIGALIAVPSAITLGIAVGLNLSIKKIIFPLIALTYPIPKLVILPFLMIILGIGDISKIAIIAIGIFYLVLLNVIHSINSLPSYYFDIIYIYQIPFYKKIFQIFLKGIMPDIFNGCKIGINYGLVMVVAGEFIAAQNGLGFFIWNAWDQFRIIDMYSGLLIFSLIGLSIFIIFDQINNILPWIKRKHNAK